MKEVELKDRLKELRLEKNISQEELGKQTGIHPMNISKWERGVRLPSVTSIKILAKFFDVTAGQLIGTEEL